MQLERGADASSPPSSHASGQKQSGARVALEIGQGDDFDMEIERGGALVSQPTATSGRPNAGVIRTNPSGTFRAAGSPPVDIDVAYRRSDLQHVASTPSGPTASEKLVATLATAVPFVGVAALLFKLVHRHGGRNITHLLPHAFDATSTPQSGAFALAALATAISLGFLGLKLRPRSYAIIVSGATMLLASLAMVTVTLVSTDEHPTPPDGALLIPYVVPLALILLGFGVARRGSVLFLEGGARRAATVLVGAIGGALVFAAIETSAIAARLP
jgi:hypothetical protein